MSNVEKQYDFDACPLLSCCCHVGNRGQYELGQELSFGDALKAHVSPDTHQNHHQSSSGGVMMLSDLIEEHGPLAASAMSSPTHTTTFVLPAQQTSPAQLAGLAPDSHLDPLGCSFGLQQQQQLIDPAAQQLALPMTDASVAAGIAAGDLMTFQVDGQIKLGLRPRQLTFSGSAQQAQQQQPQLRQQLHGSNEARPAAQLAPANAASPHAAAEIYSEARHSELSPVPLLPSHAASDASNAFADMTAADAVQPGSAATMEPHSGQIANDLQQQGSLIPKVPVSVAATEPAELQAGQQLTNVAPSLSWPAAAAPSRQSSGLPPPLSQQQSGAVPPFPQQLSAVVTEPIKQTSAVAATAEAAPLQQNSGVLSRQNSQQQQSVPFSRQASRSCKSASRQGSGVQLPLSQQASAAAPGAAQHSAAAGTPQQTAANGPGQGLERAWAALLPSLLASASQQHYAAELNTLPSAALPTMVQQGINEDAKQQTVGDILKMWAPIAGPTAAGNNSSLAGPDYRKRNVFDGANADLHNLLRIRFYQCNGLYHLLRLTCRALSVQRTLTQPCSANVLTFCGMSWTWYHPAAYNLLTVGRPSSPEKSAWGQ